MKLAKDFERFICPPIPYSFTQGPDKVRNLDAARVSGLNCVALAHLVLRGMFNLHLPPDRHSYELYSDTTNFASVGSVQDLNAGDLVWFGVQSPRVEPDAFVPEYDQNGKLVNWRDHGLRHVAIATGEISEGGDAVLLHATHIEGSTTLWPLSRFAEHARYVQMYRISRLIDATISDH